MGSLLLYLAIRWLLANLWLLLIPVFLWAVKKTLQWQERKAREELLRKSGIDEIDTMTTDGPRFEERLAVLFRDKGFKAFVTPKTADYGADVIATDPDGRTIAIQAKCYSPGHKVGKKAVDEINTGLRYWDCSAGMVITNAYFTENAKIAAAHCGIELWDRDRLIRELAQVNETKQGQGSPCPSEAV